MNEMQMIEDCLRAAGGLINIRDARILTGLPYKTVYYYLNDSTLAYRVMKDYSTEPHSYMLE